MLWTLNNVLAQCAGNSIALSPLTTGALSQAGYHLHIYCALPTYRLCMEPGVSQLNRAWWEQRTGCRATRNDQMATMGADSKRQALLILVT
jgi:hypothetical protein